MNILQCCLQKAINKARTYRKHYVNTHIPQTVFDTHTHTLLPPSPLIHSTFSPYHLRSLGRRLSQATWHSTILPRAAVLFPRS